MAGKGFPKLIHKNMHREDFGANVYSLILGRFLFYKQTLKKKKAHRPNGDASNGSLLKEYSSIGKKREKIRFLPLALVLSADFFFKFFLRSPSAHLKSRA